MPQATAVLAPEFTDRQLMVASIQLAELCERLLESGDRSMESAVFMARRALEEAVRIRNQHNRIHI